MAAYLFANVEVTDPVVYEDYRRQVPATIAAYGGRYLVRGGAVEVLEGGGTASRVVILEFPDMARLKAFYRSPEYAPLLALRTRSTRSTVAAIEGI
ncbi:MAG: D-fructose-6-phosphate amidotransferase [Methylibium sp. NZG]|nr:MAG: D-fructose-6-phosphate amidotransferase [Methylibium sp. NZG]